MDEEPEEDSEAVQVLGLAMKVCKMPLIGDMDCADAKAFKSARGIFDCTCIKVSAIAT